MSQRLRQCIKSRLSKRDEEGFTLIELLVVLLIMGILLAIAIPTYLSVTSSTNTTAAQANLQTALTATKAFYVTNNQAYNATLNTSVTGTSLTLDPAGTNSTGPSIISMDGSQSTDQAAVLVAKSTDGNCYVVVDAETALTAAIGNLPSGSVAGTWYGDYTPATATSCSATSAEGTSGPTNWSQSESLGW